MKIQYEENRLTSESDCIMKIEWQVEVQYDHYRLTNASAKW